MKHILFILGSERYNEVQVNKAIAIAATGGYAEVFVPTPDGSSPLSGKIPYNPPVTTFKCGTMIVPGSILTKINDHHRASTANLFLTFCDLNDTFRCEVNRIAAADAGFQSDVLKTGQRVRKITPAYEYQKAK